MSRTTLLLNASYEPLSVIPWERAITMLFLDKVEIIEEYEGRHIRSASKSFGLPSVVRLLKYVRRRRFGIKFSRQNVYFRDNHTCQYCGKKPPEVELSLDHVNPKTYGGRSHWENIVACCVRCNRRKGGRTPEQAGMKLLNKPRKPKTFAHVSVWSRKHNTPEQWLIYLPLGAT